MRKSTVLALILLLSVSSPGAVAAAQLSADAAFGDYGSLTELRYTAGPVPVPEGGIVWQEDTASWRLESGRIWLQEATSGGHWTGMVFEGSGRFHMTIPDRIELAQLRRFAQRPEAEEIDEPFTRLVLRTSDGLPIGDLKPHTAAFVPNKLAQERHDIWLRKAWHDADARVITALLRPGDRYVRIAMDTVPSGWLVYELDAQRREEIRVERYHPKYDTYESWLSLAIERDSRGRPAGKWRPPIDVRHLEIIGDLTELGRQVDQIRARMQTTVHFTTANPDARALHFSLHPLAEVKSVSDPQHQSLLFLRHHLGARTTALPKRLWDDALVVLLPEPAGEQLRRLVFEYEMDLRNYAPGRTWYPTGEDQLSGPSDLYTARMELTVRKNRELRAMGQKEEEHLDGNRKTSIWTVDDPVRMLTFTFTKQPMEGRIGYEDLPEVVCFSTQAGFGSKGKFFDTASQIAASIDYFQKLFASKLNLERVYAVGIDDPHGQAFRGFIHLSEQSFAHEYAGANELFRAHEVAHQWWGHKVGWASYRDVWLNEALAEYSAMLFVAAAVDGGPRYFQQILEVKTHELHGSIKKIMSQFSRPWIEPFNPVRAARIGPIGHGYRADTADVPLVYYNQIYNKGPLVIHMLRTMMRQITGSDETFIAVLRDFIATHEGRAPSTEDFKAVLRKHAPTDWDWFFDQWIYGAAIPTYSWSYRVAPAAGGGGQIELVLNVAQSEVPAGFRMPVPVRLEFAAGRFQEVLVMVAEAHESFTFDLPEMPAKVIFNPEFAVLARVKRQ